MMIYTCTCCNLPARQFEQPGLTGWRDNPLPLAMIECDNQVCQQYRLTLAVDDLAPDDKRYVLAQAQAQAQVQV